MELSQFKRDIKVVGTAKEIKNERSGVSKNSGKAYTAYTLVVLVENAKTGTLDEINVKFFSMEGTKPYQSQQKFFQEGKTIAVHGRENADKVSIAGQLELEEYMSNGKHVIFNNLQGAFIHRLDEGDATKPQAVANVETVITEITDRLDGDDLPTGEKLIQGFSIGYKEQIVVIKDAIVPKPLVESFVNIYKEGQTAMLTYQFINRAINEEVEEEVDDSPVAAFGNVAEIESFTFTNYDTRTLVIGGLPPYDDSLALTSEEIKYALELRKKKETEVLNSKPAEKQDSVKQAAEQSSSQGFGGLSDSDVPDF